MLVNIFNMVKRFLLFLFIIGLFSAETQAQVYTPYNLFSHNLFLFNPAHTGDRDQLAAFAGYRQHLTGLEGAPVYQYAGLHSPITQKMNLGGLIQSQQAGLFQGFGLRLDYSYRTQISEKQFLGLGINGGYYTRLLKRDDIFAYDTNDPFIVSDNYQRDLFFGGAGVEYRYAAFSADISLPIIYSTNNSYFMRYLGRIAYKIQTNNKQWAFTPEAVGAFNTESQYAYRIGATVQYSDFIRLQTLYKQNNSLVFAAGFRIGKMSIEYAYDTNSGILSDIGGPSHEISLTYGMFQRNPKDTSEVAANDPDLLKQKINGQTYDKYVQANNYGFYNNMLTLTDSVRREKKEAAKRDSLRKAIVNRDSIENLKKDTTQYIQKVAELTDEEKSVLERGVFFELGSANITKESADYLHQVGQILEKNKRIKILISGHTCDLGSDEINQKYARDRAEAVKYFLVHNVGIAPKRIVTEAKGPSDPIVPNIDDEHRQQNRRVIFSLVQ